MNPRTGGGDEGWIDSPFLWEENTPAAGAEATAAVGVEGPTAGPAGPAGAPGPVAAPGEGDLAEVAVAGEGWEAYEGQEPDPSLLETDLDTSLVEPQEMTGVWLTTELGRESPVRIDGAPIEPEELGVSAETAERLRDWAAMWHRDWDAERGWRPHARIDDYEALGLWLARRVKDAVGATGVTLQPAHLGRCRLTEIEPRERRVAQVVRVANAPGQRWPVRGTFVTDSGVGSFTSEVNARLEMWAQAYQRAHEHGRARWDPRARAAYEAERDDLVDLMRAELGPDYVLDVAED